MDHVRPVVFCLCAFVVAACGGGGGSSAPPVTVTVTPAMASVMYGEQIQLAATTANTKGEVTWSSSNTAIATVDSTGLVMATNRLPFPPNVSQVTITATSGEASGAATLSITLGIEFSSVSAGSNHTCGIGSVPGSVAYNVAYCWGDNSFGQLGNGTMTNSAVPVPVSGGRSFSTLVAGGNQTCGVISFDVTSPPYGGAMYCWGDNSSGQLGNGTTTNSTTPSLISGGLVFIGVSVGGKHVCADGYCWGDNSFGQLGNGTMTNSSVPVPITTGDIGEVGYIAGIGNVSAGSSHTCGIAGGNDGFITYSASVCWGDNSSGQLGNGTTTNSAVPVVLSVAPGYPFSAGTLFTCALPASSCWGTNGVGQLGNGTTTNSTTPVIISGDLGFTSISSGGMHACGAGRVPGPTSYPYPGAYCWGDNSSGQLGNGTMTNSATPVAVAGNLEFKTVSAGGNHTCGIGGVNGQGAVYCWGDNTYGQLGNSWTTSSAVPINVAGGP